MKRLRRWTIALIASASLVTVVLTTTGWSSAVASNIQSVFVTNDANNAVPVAPGDEPGYFGTTTTLATSFDFAPVLQQVLPAGSSVRITSLTLTNGNSVGAGFRIGSTPPVAGSCSFSDPGGGSHTDFQGILPVIAASFSTVHLAFPEPIAIGRKAPWCLELKTQFADFTSASGPLPEVTTIGYTLLPTP